MVSVVGQRRKAGELLSGQRTAAMRRDCLEGARVRHTAAVPDETVVERVLRLLRVVGGPLDDDEIARRLQVSPRQTVNQVCRKLVAAGQLRRRLGADSKLVNELLPPAAAQLGSVPESEVARTRPPAGPEASPAATRPDGDSSEQRNAERWMLADLSRRLDVRLVPRRMAVAGVLRVELDGGDEDLTVLVEAWAHQGPPKPAQRNKVLADALKLVWVASTLPRRPRLVLCLSDHQAAAPFTGERSWAARALADLGVEVVVVDLPVDIRAAVVAAQLRQFR